MNGVLQKSLQSITMGYGSSQHNMSKFLNSLGIDKDLLQWQDLALCLGMETNLFFDSYETDVNIAKSIDQACMSCPVIAMCYKYGTESDNYGVWGGVYLSSGTPDKSKNSHKTKEINKRLKVLHG
jgi:hypothetical protein